MEGQYERVSRQSRELLYSVPAALCDEIARAATAELAERHSGLGLYSGFPATREPGRSPFFRGGFSVQASSKPRSLEQVHFSVILLVFFCHSTPFLAKSDSLHFCIF